MPVTLATLAAATMLAVLTTGFTQKPPAGTSSSPAGLTGTAWRAVEVAGTQVAAQPSPEREPHLVFGTGGRVSGADGCNHLAGPYTKTGDAIAFGNLAGTMMACPATEEIARRFRSALKDTAHWRIEEGRLTFYGATGKPLAVFEPRQGSQAAGAPALEGVIEDGGLFLSLMADGGTDELEPVTPGTPEPARAGV